MTDDDPLHTCDTCGKEFATKASLGKHAKSHRTRPCRHCFQPYSINGHSTHEQHCTGQPATNIFYPPTEVTLARIADYTAHATHLPPNTTTIIPRTGEPITLTQQAACQMLTNLTEPALAIPTSMLTQLMPDEPERWRRVTDETRTTPTPAAAPETSIWDHWT